MKSIFVNQLGEWLRIAITRDGALEYFAVEGPETHDPIGAIHLGRITNVVPAIQAAFLEIDKQQNAFLNRDDLPETMIKNNKAPLESLLKEGQTLLVQIKKPAFQGKLVQVTADPRLVGFFTILTPLSAGIRFSKRFKGDAAAIRIGLAQAMNQNSGEPVNHDSEAGLIVRSGSATVTLPRIVTEWSYLSATYMELCSAAGQGPPRRLHEDSLIMRCLYDNWAGGIRSVYFDHRLLYERYKQLLMDRNPELLPAVKFHVANAPLFDTYKLESEIHNITAAKVWLKSGGSLHFHQTEAMVTIDVNTGKQSRRRSGASVALKTNLEAVKEAARQIRVRNLSGLIVMDLINPPEPGWRTEVNQSMARELARDPARTQLLPVNRLGILSLSRQRNRLDLNRALNQACGTCQGTGWVKKWTTLAREIQQTLAREAPGMKGETLVVACGKSLATYLESHHEGLFDDIERIFGIKIRVEHAPETRGRSFQIRL